MKLYIKFILIGSMLAALASCHSQKSKNIIKEESTNKSTGLIIKTNSNNSLQAIELNFNNCELTFVKNISLPLNTYLFSFDSSKCDSAQLIEQLVAMEQVEMAEVDKNLSIRRNRQN